MTRTGIKPAGAGSGSNLCVHYPASADLGFKLFRHPSQLETNSNWDALAAYQYQNYVGPRTYVYHMHSVKGHDTRAKSKVSLGPKLPILAFLRPKMLPSTDYDAILSSHCEAGPVGDNLTEYIYLFDSVPRERESKTYSTDIRSKKNTSQDSYQET
ncbi:hypothetical protein B0H17DRAFT_1137136 [Mycena rosella]|uniref:Uncharacterized protein n=1 Tax=Mycena rosella TaxID=1033263 RepID=A0AAD7D938_MYCRO|nr:hypothetical protein B0H17DRAFT_1137136 [Mycena rosella]